MVDALGVESALRVRQKMLEERADQFRARRDPGNPGCFRIRQPLVSMTKGGWYECAFSVHDQLPGQLKVAGFTPEFRPIGPI
jgi:hypothetical protein